MTDVRSDIELIGSSRSNKYLQIYLLRRQNGTPIANHSLIRGAEIALESILNTLGMVDRLI